MSPPSMRTKPSLPRAVIVGAILLTLVAIGGLAVYFKVVSLERERLHDMQIDILQVLGGRALTYDELIHDLHECTSKKLQSFDASEVEALYILIGQNRVAFKILRLLDTAQHEHSARLYWVYGSEPDASHHSGCKSGN